LNITINGYTINITPLRFFYTNRGELVFVSTRRIPNLMKENIILIKGDITAQTTDAIVNAANHSLLGGGGVDGAIHEAAGPDLREECMKFSGCETGEAIITSGHNLKAKYVIHTVGPVWRDGHSNEDELLRRAYYNSLKVADENGIRSISFPSISTGAYSFPLDRAARIAISTVSAYLEDNDATNIKKVVFVLFSDLSYNAFTKAMEM
jgi:O-acetyl-ADP-ribose deacetylase (regulator of RNase III)